MRDFTVYIPVSLCIAFWLSLLSANWAGKRTIKDRKGSEKANLQHNCHEHQKTLFLGNPLYLILLDKFVNSVHILNQKILIVYDFYPVKVYCLLSCLGLGVKLHHHSIVLVWSKDKYCLSFTFHLVYWTCYLMHWIEFFRSHPSLWLSLLSGLKEINWEAVYVFRTA